MYKKRDRGYEKSYRKRKWLPVLLVLVLIACCLGAVYYVLEHYRVTTVYVDGNLHYTQQEIQELVMDGPLGNNSLYLSLQYKNKSITGIPFVAAMDVEILTPNTIRIRVFEKSLAGFVEYLGRYLYFDKDGMVVESSIIKTTGIPQITGLSFDYIVVGEPLPVENQDIFYQILSVTQTLAKYDLSAERIYFDEKEEMTLYFGDIKVDFGGDDNLDEKIILLQSMMGKLEGLKGTLYISDYSQNKKTYTFEPET